jgi:hypothetical protein
MKHSVQPSWLATARSSVAAEPQNKTENTASGLSLLEEQLSGEWGYNPYDTLSAAQPKDVWRSKRKRA